MESTQTARNSSLGNASKVAPAIAPCGGLAVVADSLALLEYLVAVPCVVRDQDLVLRWCNDAYARLSQRSKQELLGTKIEAFIPAKAAAERSEAMLQVLETGQSVRYYQFGADQRLLCTLLPIDADSFGYRGVLIMVQRETGMAGSDHSCDGIPVLRTPCLDKLDVLSPAELRVLLHLGRGRTTAEIGEHLSRSAKTVEKQIESVHRKLGTSSRAELVKLAVERGLQAFSDDDWEQIIEGARSIRRSGSGPTDD